MCSNFSLSDKSIIVSDDGFPHGIIVVSHAIKIRNRWLHTKVSQFIHLCLKTTRDICRLSDNKSKNVVVNRH